MRLDSAFSLRNFQFQFSSSAAEVIFLLYRLNFHENSGRAAIEKFTGLVGEGNNWIRLLLKQLNENPQSSP
jgi:hypothetical protein